MRGELLHRLATVALLVFFPLVTATGVATAGEMVDLEGQVKGFESNGKLYFTLNGYVLLPESGDWGRLGYYYIRLKGEKVDQSPLPGAPALMVKDMEVLDKGDRRLILEGTVAYEKLEGGFYAVDGYRLAGGYDFSSWEGKTVRVAGLPDTEPSIFMTKAIKVFSIEEISREAEGKPVELKGPLTLRVHNAGYGVHWSVGDYTLVGAQEFGKYLNQNVFLQGTLSSGPPLAEKKVVVVKYIRFASPSEIPSSDDIKAEDLVKPRKPIRVMFNGRTVPLNVEPLLLNGRTLMALSDLEPFGLKGAYNSQDTVLIQDRSDGQNQLKLVVGKNLLSSPKGGVMALDSLTLEYQGTLLIPLRAVMETLGFTVVWDAENWIVNLTR